MFDFNSKQKKPDERIARCAAEYLLGTGFDGVDMAVKILGVSRSQRYLGKWYFHQQQRVLGMVVAGTQNFVFRVLQDPGRGCGLEGFKLEQASIKVVKFVRNRARSEIWYRPSQSQAGNNDNKAPQGERRP